MAPPRTRDNRSQLAAEIDDHVFHEIQRLWPLDGRKRWQVIQELLELGLEQYKAKPRDHRQDQPTLSIAG